MRPGKYADSAVPALLARLATERGPHRLPAGAAHRRRADVPDGQRRASRSIGDQNVEAARKALQERKIPIIFEDTGGSAGRSVTFDNATGKVSVKTLQAIARKGETR